MVEIEEEYGDRFGLWLDGNEPHAQAVYNLTLNPCMNILGISESLRKKHSLSDYKTKRRMGKPELWEHLLAAQMEQILMDLEVPLEEFDGFLLKPQSASSNPSNELLIQGVTPTLDKRRITYAQMIVCCPPKYSDTARKAIHTVAEKLYFSYTKPSDYEDYPGFEAQYRQFLQYMTGISRDMEAYKNVGRETGIKIYRLLP